MALIKPLVLRPVLLNPEEAEDNLGLTGLLRSRLAGASRPLGRGKGAAIVYVPEDDFPGGIRPTGVYSVAGDQVTVKLTLKRDGAVVARLAVEGTKAALPDLADRMAKAVLKEDK